MAKTKVQKKEIIEKYKKMLNDFCSLIVFEPRGITPNEINSLKKEVFQYGAEVHVVKNTLFSKALVNSGFDTNEFFESGARAVLFTKNDFVSPAKSLQKFINDTKIDKSDFRVEIIGAYIEKEILGKQQASEIAEMPSKTESISAILGIIDMSITGVINVLEDAPRSIVSVIDQVFK